MKYIKNEHKIEECGARHVQRSGYFEKMKAVCEEEGLGGK